MSIIHKWFLVCLCLFGPLLAWSQTGNTYVSRDAFYDSLEARARALSQRLADLSGTEPIPFERPPPTILSTRKPPPSQAQSAFDALPETPRRGATSTIPTAPEPDDGTLYRADGTPVKAKEEVPEAPVKEGPPRKEMERDRGQYFIQPFVGLAFMSSDASFSQITDFDSMGDPQYANYDLETEVGHTIGVGLGRRWKNFEAELHFSYASVGYESADLTNTGASFSALDLASSGEVELFQVGARVGYGLPVGDSGWVRAAGGFGYGKRRDFLSIHHTASTIDSFSSSDNAFTYDLLFSLGYEIDWGLDAFLAYRLLGSSGNGSFDKVAMHLFELGLGANF